MNEHSEKIREKLKEAKELIHEGCWEYGYGSTVEMILQRMEKLDVLGLEWGDKLQMPCDFTLRKGSDIMNPATNYYVPEDEWAIHWDNGNIGRLQFVEDTKYYNLINEEWDEFMDKLLSYNPVNYDRLNTHIVYNIKEGKEVMKDYKQICSEIQEKINKKLAKQKLEDLKKQYEELEEKIGNE